MAHLCDLDTELKVCGSIRDNAMSYVHCDSWASRTKYGNKCELNGLHQTSLQGRGNIVRLFGRYAGWVKKGRLG